MRISTGHYVDGKEFYGRARELDIMAQVLGNKRASLIIPGPRRIGKTSLIKEFIRRHKDTYNIVYFDLEGRKSFIELCRDLTRRLEKEYPVLIKKHLSLTRPWNALAKMLPELKIAGLFGIKTGELHPDAKELLDRMEEIFELLNQQNFIFAFDEFSDFLWELKERSHEEVKLFLEWLRRMRQEEKIRLIISGSVNIISTVEELNVPDLINDLTDQEIFPLTDKEVRELIAKLLSGINTRLTDKGLNFAAARLNDGIPFFIQLFASGLRSYGTTDHDTYDEPDIKAVYHKITGRQHKEFIDLHSRLKDYLKPDEYGAAKKILAHLAADPMALNDLLPYVEETLPDKERLHKLLKRLTDECYIKKEKAVYRFVSPMLADWWHNAYDWEK